MSDEEGQNLQQEMGFLWENESWGLSNSDNSGMNPRKTSSSNDQKEEGDALGKSKRISRGKRSSGGEGKDGKGGESDDHEIHIWTERERRKKMRNMFASLHALLPQLPSKADKSTIVDEAVNYIKSLENTLENLQKQKLEKLQSVSSTLGNEQPPAINSQWHPYDSREAFIADQGSSAAINGGTSNPSTSLSVPQNPVGFETWTSSNVVLSICGDEAQLSICSPKKPGLFTGICFVLEKHKIEVLSAHVSSDNNRSMFMIQAHVNRALDQFPEALSAKEIFRQAAGEIMPWLS